MTTMKYPCRRKNCEQKQVNGRCSIEHFIPNDENTCSHYQDKEVEYGWQPTELMDEIEAVKELFSKMLGEDK